jgi:hypothetical protein
MMGTPLWEFRRCITALAVLALHVAGFAALLWWNPAPRLAASRSSVLELLYLPPSHPPLIRWENPRPHPLSAGLPSSIAPPSLDSVESSSPPARSNGTGSAVDWRAEARRALQAYEIRTARRGSGESQLAMSAEDNWTRGQHHAGERYKTDKGDWIVWINASCYQIASATSTMYALGGSLPQTVCPRPESTP